MYTGLMYSGCFFSMCKIILHTFSNIAYRIRYPKQNKSFENVGINDIIEKTS